MEYQRMKREDLDTNKKMSVFVEGDNPLETRMIFTDGRAIDLDEEELWVTFPEFLGDDLTID